MPRRLAVAAFLLAAVKLGHAEAQPAVDTSMQSFSGVIETPHAETLPGGRAALSYTNHAPIPGLSDTDPQSVIFNFGLFDGLELGGRLTEVKGDDAARDLLGHAKLRLFSRSGWPSLAVGIQDFQGNQLFGSSAYAVSSWSPVNWLRVSAGYGFREARLDGGFGSVELAPLPFVRFLGEYSDEATRAGAALRLPVHGSLSATVKGAYDLDREETTVLAELQFPLGAPMPRAESGAPERETVALVVAEPGRDVLLEGLRRAGYQAIRSELSEQAATVCVDPGLAFRSAVDAVGVALGLMDARLPESSTALKVILQREGRAQLEVQVSRADFRRFMATGDDAALLGAMSARWAAANACSALDEAAVAPTRYEAVLAPNLVTFYGTEVGVLDADLALRLRLQANWGRAGTFYVSLLSPSARTEDFEPGQIFENQRSRSGVDQALYQFYMRPSPNWSVLTSLGFMRVFHNDAAAVLQEQVISSATGRHAMRLHVGAFAGTDKQLSIAIADYAWLWPEQNLRFSLGGGRFAAGDTGGRAELLRYFGDTTLSLFVRGRDRREAVGGINVSIPLVPRFWAASDSSAWRLRGAERWRHGASSSFSDDDGSNPLRPRLLVEPLPDRNLRDSYLDVDRVAPDWVLEHAWRLRDAYTEHLLRD